MKKILFAFLLVGATMNAQLIKFGTTEYGTVSAFVDPVGSCKERGLDFGAELEYVGNWGYVKTGFQMFPALLDGYTDVVGGAGLNFNTYPFDYLRFYSGVRLGYIFRGIGLERGRTYPLAGIEGGIDFNLNDKWFIGVSAIGDWREDFMYSGANPEFQTSGRVRVGRRFDIKK